MSRDYPPAPSTGKAPDGQLGNVLVSEDEVRARVQELGEEITADYAGRTPLLVGVLRGAYVFMADIARAGHAVPQVG